MNWQEWTLDDLCSIQSGGTPRRNVAGYYEGAIPWVKIADITFSDGTINETEEYITDAGLKAIGNRLFPKGTLLLAMYGSVGKTAVANVDLATNQAILGLQIRDSCQLDARYLLRYLESIQPYLLSIAQGVTQKNLSATIIRSLKLKIPPLEQQKRIAAILDKADELRAKRRRAIVKLDELLKSVFLELFGDAATNTRNWNLVKAAQLIKSIDGGVSYGGEQRPLQVGEYGVLKISAVTSGTFKPNEFKAVAMSDIKPEHRLIHPRKGDLLFSRANTRELVGAVCIVDKTNERLFLPDKLWRIELHPELCTNSYLKTLLSDADFRQILTRTATGTSGSMLNISKEKLRNLEVPLPPIHVQTQFDNVVGRVSDAIEKAVRAQETTNQLFFTLQARAFSGDLTPEALDGVEAVAAGS